MKIAIASSGLGHVARGIETWAIDMALALAERGEDVTLFAGGEIDLPKGERFPKVEVLQGVRRFERRTELLVHFTPRFAWRWGLKAAYGWEQFHFWRKLYPRLRKGGFAILNVQDPMLAFWCSRARLRGRVKTKEILGHGTEEPLDWLAQLKYVQHLAPWHLEKAERELSRKWRYSSREWVAIPNFVDTETFKPASRDDQWKAREALGVPGNAFILGVAATIKRPHKRIDYLIREFAQFLQMGTSRRGDDRPPFLVLAGARTPKSDELVALADEIAPGRVKFCFDLPRSEMPALYHALDIFTLTSLFEMMPIAVLESLASGVPVICNNMPNLVWMVGGDKEDQACIGGACVDMSESGALASFLASTTQDEVTKLGLAARKHAETTFSKQVVIGQYIDYYKAITSEAETSGRGPVWRS